MRRVLNNISSPRKTFLSKRVRCSPHFLPEQKSKNKTKTKTKDKRQKQKIQDKQTNICMTRIESLIYQTNGNC